MIDFTNLLIYGFSTGIPITILLIYLLKTGQL